MKKSIAILMLTLCLALLCACGETAEPAPETPAPTAQEVTAQALPEKAPAAQLEASAQEPEEAAEQTDDAPAQEPEEAPEEPSALETALTFVDQDAAVCACGNRQKTLEEADLSMSVNGVEVTTKSSVDTLLGIFDGKYETAEAVSCVYSGMECTYSSEDFSVFTYPGDDGAEHLMEAYAQANVQTARGITIGSSLKDVEDAYGSDYTRNGNVVSFELPASNDQMVPAGIYFELYDDMVIAIGIVCEHRAQ